jgi:hypothetical protein
VSGGATREPARRHPAKRRAPGPVEGALERSSRSLAMLQRIESLYFAAIAWLIDLLVWAAIEDS